MNPKLNNECDCEFYDPDNTGDGCHYHRTCEKCKHPWLGLHCPHDSVQNNCPKCDFRPETLNCNKIIEYILHISSHPCQAPGESDNHFKGRVVAHLNGKTFEIHDFDEKYTDPSCFCGKPFPKEHEGLYTCDFCGRKWDINNNQTVFLEA